MFARLACKHGKLNASTTNTQKAEEAATIKAKGGRIVSGSLTNIESKWDDPDGIGAVYIKTGPDYGEIVFADEFECLLEEGEEA